MTHHWPSFSSRSSCMTSPHLTIKLSGPFFRQSTKALYLPGTLSKKSKVFINMSLLTYSEIQMNDYYQMGSVFLFSVRWVREAVCSTPVLQTFTYIYRIGCSGPACNTCACFNVKFIHVIYLGISTGFIDTDSMQEIKERSSMCTEKSPLK